MYPTKSNHLVCFHLLLILSLCVSLKTAIAQERAVPEVVKGDANSCELNSLYLDYLAQDARSSSERVFVIARLGRAEKSRALNRARLESARFHLLINRTLNKDLVVFAEGDPVGREGRIEFYLGSKLYLVSLAKQGGNVCFFCCEDRFPKRR